MRFFFFAYFSAHLFNMYTSNAISNARFNRFISFDRLLQNYKYITMYKFYLLEKYRIADIIYFYWTESIVARSMRCDLLERELLRCVCQFSDSTARPSFLYGNAFLNAVFSSMLAYFNDLILYRRSDQIRSFRFEMT